ncbi:hypothetical protein, partial [Microcoleus sp.]|uniref:hypothetical protein n=1 Tax=Microcoleus sp. TaxID=44472 RepID=UPI003593DA69
MKKKGIWLAVAVALLALSAWLMSRGDKEKPTVRPPKVEFPRRSTPEESTRNQKRRTLPPLPAPSADAEGFLRRRDPMLVALPVDPKRSAMVFELEALKEAPIMQIWIDCLLENSEADRYRRGLERFKERFGVDPLEDVERIAVSSDRVMLLQGAFEDATFDPAEWTQRTYGQGGVIYENVESGRVVGMWGDDMMIASGQTDSAGPVEEAIDRLESTDPAQKSILDDHQAYGDVYGVLSPDDLAKMFPEEQAALADKVREVVERVDIHVDASDDVAMVADVDGPGAEDLEDLSKSFGAALAVGRIKAQSDGDEKLAQLLDFAKVKPPRGGGFSLDVALPIEVLKDLGPCRKDRGP